MKRTKATFLLRGLLCGLALWLYGCEPTLKKIGAVLPVTGTDQVYGEAVKRGLELAYAELKAGPDGKNIDLQIQDSQSNPAKAQELLEKAYSDGCVAAIGGITSDEAKTMIEVADRWDRVLLSPTASSPDLTGISRNFYRIFPSDFNAASKMADFAARTLKIESVVVIAEERTYGKGVNAVFQPAFEGLGGHVLEVIEIPANAVGDITGLIGRVMTLNPDAVYLVAYEAGVSAMIEELHRQRYNGKILTTSAFATPSAIAKVGQDAEGVFLTQSVFELDSEHAHVQKFVKAFEEKYGERPDIFAAHGYDALKVIAAAVKDRAALPSEVFKGLRDAIKEFPGVTGAIQFDEKGDVPKYPRVYVVGEDLGLYDYTERVRRQQEELMRRREELRKQLEDLQRQASQLGKS